MRSEVDDMIGADDRDQRALGVGLAIAGLVVVVLLVALASVVVVDSEWDAARTRAASVAEQAAVAVGSGVAGVVAALEDATHEKEVEVGQVAEGGGALPDGEPPADDEVEIVVIDGPGLQSAPDDGSLVADPAVQDAMARAGDSGEMVLSAPTAGEPVRVVLVRAVYSPRSELLTSVGERRRALVALVLGVVDAASFLPAESGEELQIADGDAVLAGAPSDPAASTTATVPVLDRRWRVTTTVDRPELGSVWLLVAMGGIATVLLLVAARIWQRNLARHQHEAAAAKEHASAVLTYAGVMQESHDLGQVVPALAVQLSDRLGLAGISFSVAGSGGSLREIFVHGDPPDRTVGARSAVPRSASAGETVGLHLRRAERSIGLLRIRCGRPLGPSEFDQVRIAGELVTSTVVTSRSLEQQQDAVERLRTLDELKTAFLGTASHELRTPVTAISGFAFMLSDRWESLSPDNRRMFADRIASNARVLESLVQDLLDFARLERGELTMVLETVDLAVVTNRVLDRLAPVWSSHTVERSIAAGSYVHGDVAGLERIVTNLVSNAVKFSPSGSTVLVEVHGDEQVQLVVEDEGPGVPAAEQDRIFVRFFRGEGDAVMRTNGVGIGLSVVQDYITQMGGRVRVENGARGGARFVIELDRRPAPTRQEQEDSDVTA